ncbi:translocation/assembly module TamB [Persicobacter sp. CCB-QB2]|uniref:translocation/assembly module TamB n=1 Tax=Persicobacter sp. CCB-QB2 TaxID=1561025 RepID=UPI0006A9912D|nr:translocation/assembly module TamB [Persicobacter sp. CCB-QB2]
MEEPTQEINKTEATPKRNRRFLRISLWIAAVMLFSWILIGSLLRLPFFQTLLADYFLEKVGEKIQADMEIGRIEFSWVDEAILHNVSVKDSLGLPVINVNRLDAHFAFWNLLLKGDLQFEHAHLKEADVQLIAHGEKGYGINQWVDGIKAITKKKDPTDSSHVHFKVGSITVENSTFRMQNAHIDSVDFGFDNHNFTVKEIFGEVENFRIDSDTISMKVLTMQAHEQTSDLPVLDFHSDFMICRNALLMDKTNLYLGESRLQGDLHFFYNGWEDYSDFMEKVRIDAKVSQSYLTSRDLAAILPFLRGYLDTYRFKGHWRGPISNFDIRNMDLSFGENSVLRGRISFSGLPEFYESFIDADFKNSRINVKDLYPYIGNSPQRELKELDNLEFKGRFTGFPLDFVANGKFEAPVGTIISDINFKILEGGLPYYKGHLITENFHLGKVMDAPEYIQTLSMEGDIEGQGLTVTTADFNLNAEASKLGVNGYDYHNIETKGRFSKEIFIGQLNVNDSSLQMKGNAAVNLGHRNPYLKVTADVPFADLNSMKVTDKVSSLSGSLNIDFKGLHPDELEGTAQAKNLVLNYGEDTVAFQHMRFTSTIEKRHRVLDLYSDFGQFRVIGDFSPIKLVNEVPMMLSEYLLALKNDPEEIAAYYQQKAPVDYQNPSYAQFDIRFFDFNPIMNMFSPDFYMTTGSNISGKLLMGYSYNLVLDTYMDSLHWNGNSLSGAALSLKTSKYANDPDPQAIVTLTADRQRFFNLMNTNNLVTEINWFEKHMEYLFQVKQDPKQNHADLTGTIDFSTKYTKVNIQAPSLFMLGDYWKLNPQNKITLKDGRLHFEKVTLSSSRQRIALTGAISHNPKEEFRLMVEDFELNHLENFIDTEVNGILNGYLSMRNYYNTPLIQNRIFVDNFSFNHLPLGQMKGNATWDAPNSKLDIFFEGDRAKENILALNGAYYPYREQDNLDLKLDIKQVPLAVAEPFLKSYASKLKGNLSGDISIKGKLSHPEMTGFIAIDTASVKIDYLQTTYQTNGIVEIEPERFVLKSLTVTDGEGNYGNVNGAIEHEGLQDFNFDIRAAFNNMMVLNTTSKDNDLYYGKAYASGNMHFFGPLSKFNIQAEMETRKNTRFNIPLASTSDEIGSQDYIEFIQKKNEFEFLKDIFEKEVKKVKVEGVNYDFKFKVTPDAFAQLIFDLQAGDIIQGRGNGDLELLINPQGDMSVFGDVVFTEGSYNFTLSNIINKEFIIEPNSKITWNGDPYSAELNIDAVYDQLTNLTAIVDTAYADSPEIRRRYPAKVMLNLKGPMMSPELNFDIDIDKYPSTFSYEGNALSLDTYVTGFKNQIHVNEQEMKRQVFSLIVLGSLAPANSFNTSNTVGSSLSEFVSNQLSYWINQVDDKLSIAVDLGQMDADAVNTFQLRLGYTFLDGRLRVSRDGGFTNEQSKVDFASIAGDWSVEYLLTESGKYRVKMYSRNNFSSLDAGLNQANSTTTGVSLLHTASFNSFKEMIGAFNPFRSKKEDAHKDKRIRHPQIDPLKPKELSPEDDDIPTSTIRQKEADDSKQKQELK